MPFGTIFHESAVNRHFLYSYKMNGTLFVIYRQHLLIKISAYG